MNLHMDLRHNPLTTHSIQIGLENTIELYLKE
jgi:hypothetical protein